MVLHVPVHTRARACVCHCASAFIKQIDPYNSGGDAIDASVQRTHDAAREEAVLCSGHFAVTLQLEDLIKGLAAGDRQIGT